MYRLGILCYASPTGLGYQTRDYVKHLKPDKLLAVDLSMYNKMPVYREWYHGYNTIWSDGVPNSDIINQFLDGLDVVFLAETPLNFYLFDEAKRRGIRTINAYNFEFLDYFKHPEWTAPTVLASPSMWGIEQVKQLNKAEVQYLPVPVEKTSPSPIHKELKTITHVIGRPAVYDRNGTLSFLSAIEQLGNKYKYRIFLQEPDDEKAKEYFQQTKNRLNEVRAKVPIEIITNLVDNSTMFDDTQLLVLPRRYGGLCLPMQEALTKGVPVVMTNISPNNYMLPEKWLVKSALRTTFDLRAMVEVYEADISDLVSKINQFSDSMYMEFSSGIAGGISDVLSWNNLLPKYEKCIAGL